MANSARQLPVVASLAVVQHRVFTDPRGSLVPIELTRAVPFQIARLFWVRDVPAGTARGGHAHKLCSQYLICVSGRVGVAASDTVSERSFELAPGEGLLVPPGIFATETYATPDSTLLVLCDRAYETEDYVHDIATLARWRQEIAG